MNVVSVTYHEDGRRTVGVACGQCAFTHQIVWPVGADVLGGSLVVAPTPRSLFRCGLATHDVTEHGTDLIPHGGPIRFQPAVTEMTTHSIYRNQIGRNEHMADTNEGKIYDREFWQHMNQDHALAGLPPVMPADQPAAEAMDDAMCLELPYDNEAVARRITGHLVKDFLNAWDAVGARQVDTSWCPEDQAGLFALSRAYGRALALRDITQLDTLRTDMAGLWRCDVKINRNCGLVVGGANADYPVQFLAIKRGQYVCAFTACVDCMEHIASGAGVNHLDYMGPKDDWTDDRKPDSWGDPFSEYDYWQRR
jgi:hypothetical protein